MRNRTPDNIVLKATLLVTSTLTVLAGAIIAPALPAMRDQFVDVPNIDFWVRLVLTLPALFIVINAPIAGYIVDRIGRKKLLVGSALLYAVAGGSGYLASTLPVILVGRALLGVAVAGVMTSATTLIADYYTGPARSRFLGLQAGFMGLGGTVFLTLGGILADVSWRAPFLIYLAALLVLPFIVVMLYEPQRERAREPIAHALADPSDCVAESVVDAGAPVPTAPASAPVKLMTFVYGTMVLIQVIFYTVPVQLPFYLRDLIGATAAQSGLAIAVMPLCFALASMAFGWVAARLDHVILFGPALGLTGLGYVLIALAGNWGLLYLGLIMGGIGLGFIVPNLNVWLANETPTALRGRALGGLTTSLFLGQFLSPVVSQPISAVVGLATTYLVAGVFLVLLAPVVILTRHRLRLLAARPIVTR